MKRREFNIAVPAIFIVGATASPVAEPIPLIVPYLFRLVLGGVVRGTIARTATTTITSSMVATASLGLRASGLVAVTAGVAYAYEKHKASEVWVRGSAEQKVTLQNQPAASSKREQVYMNYRVVDIETGQIEHQGVAKNVSVEADKPLSLSHLVKDLPYVGAKFVEGLATFDSKGTKPNPRFSFFERKVVIVADASEVTSA